MVGVATYRLVAAMTHKIFDAEGDGSQDDGTLFSLAAEFLEAARALHATPPVRLKFSSATYYLLGHSAELMLKAFLYKSGQKISALRKLNHDLQGLVSLARENGLTEKTSLTYISFLATTYKKKGFEYRTRARMTAPDLDLLIGEVGALQSAVFDKLWE